MTASGLRAGVYDRVSVLAKGTDARSVRQQNDANTAACESHQWPVVARYADPGRSASRFARKAREDYQRLLDDIKARSLDVVVFWESSRGGRELVAWATLLHECRARGVKIYITTHVRMYDLDISRDWRSLAEDGVDSAYQSEKTADQVRRDVAANAEAGRPHGRILFGYERIYHERTKALVEQRPHPDRAQTVREVFARRAAGEPKTAIAKDLRRRGVPSSGGQWDARMIGRITANKGYLGTRMHNGAGTPAIWPPLVDEVTFSRAQDSPRRERHHSRTRHLLSYVATCGGCKGPLSTTTVRGVPYYVCEDSRRCAGIREDWLDTFITAAAAEILDDPGFWAELASGSDAEVLAARGDVAKLTGRLRDYRQRAIAGTVTPESFAEIEAGLVPQIARARKHADEITLPPGLLALGGADSARARFEASPVAVRKDILRDLFSEITLLPATRKGRQPFDPERVRTRRRKPPG